MVHIQAVKEALQARSQETTLDALKERGRSHVKVIRAEHIADMIGATADELTDVRGQLEEAQNRVTELEAMLAEGQAGAPAANTAGPATTAGPAVAAADATGITDALDKIAGSLNERLDQFGRKMGISSAVEAADVKFDGLFNDDHEVDMESNMDNVQIKKKTGSGIAGNLEKLKKLKGSD